MSRCGARYYLEARGEELSIEFSDRVLAETKFPVPQTPSKWNTNQTSINTAYVFKPWNLKSFFTILLYTIRIINRESTNKCGKPSTFVEDGSH